MVKKEFFGIRKDGVKLYRSYSDIGKQLRKVGTDEVYDDAIDIDSVNYQYVEIDDKVNYEL